MLPGRTEVEGVRRERRLTRLKNQFPAEYGPHEFGAGNQGGRYRFEATCRLMRSPSKAKEPDPQPNDQRTEP